MAEGTPILTLRDVRKRYDGLEVLHGISLTVNAGEFVTLLGPSGCGKTTTLRIIAGLEDMDGGAVLLDGKDISPLPPEKRQVNMVFQNYALFPHMTVEKNIAYGLRMRGVPRAEIASRVKDMLSLVKLTGYEKRMPSQLSGGQRQRVAIARAAVLKPRVLLLDEPLGALDLNLRRQMQTELKKMQREIGITFVYITHDQEEALNMSDRIALMNNGRIVQYDTPQALYDTPNSTFSATFIGQANVLPCVVESVHNGIARIRLDGHTFDAPAPEGAHTGDEMNLCVRAERLHYSAEARRDALTGILREIDYTGGIQRARIEMSNGAILTASRPLERAQDVPLGSEVTLWWHMSSLVPRGEAAL